MLSTFQVDLLTEIFLRLPAKTLGRCKLVCKLWYNRITDIYFVNLHLQRSLATKTNLHFVVQTPKLHLTDFDTFDNIRQLDYPFKQPDHSDVYVIGTINGLLCLCRYEAHQLIIYNPTTQTNRLLPLLPVCYGEGSSKYGFGFDTVSQDYKCVWICERNFDNPNTYYCQVMVYSFNNNSWRRGPDTDFYYFNHYNITVLFHETIHWVGCRCEDRLIVTFSLQDESFSSLTVPEYEEEDYFVKNVTVLDGQLCLLVNYRSDYCHVWIMEEYGVAGSWKKVFNVVKHNSEEFFPVIVSYSSSRKGLFAILVECQDPRLAYLDLEAMQTTDVQVADFVCCEDAYLCVENLLMLDNANYLNVEEEKKG